MWVRGRAWSSCNPTKGLASSTAKTQMTTILLLQQGSPSQANSAGSGTPFFLRQAMERAGAKVIVEDCEPRGTSRALLACRTFSRRRARWSARFNASADGFAVRSRIAQRQVNAVREPVDAVIQYGSSFDPGRRFPYYVYSDDFTRNAVAEQRSWGGQLTGVEALEAEKLEDRLFVEADGVFAFSERIRRRFTIVPGLDLSSVHVAYPGANFSDPPPEVSVLTRSARPTVLFVGKEWERKGGPCVIEAFKRVRVRVPTARLVVVGPQTPVAGAGVEHVGYLSKDDPEHARRLRRLFEEAWVFCLPTTYEPFGIAFVEAMWFGLPCIGTDDWAIPEIIEEGVTGFRVAANDADAVAERIVSVLTSTAERARMSAAGRNRAETLFSWDATARRMLDVIARRTQALPGRQAA